MRFGHVFIVVEENANYSDVIANPAMPYLNSLAENRASSMEKTEESARTK